MAQKERLCITPIQQNQVQQAKCNWSVELVSGSANRSAHLHERNGNGVPKNHLNGGAGDRRQVKGAQLALQWQMHRQVAQLQQGSTRPGLRWVRTQ